jgi:hypothetical protein
MGLPSSQARPDPRVGRPHDRASAIPRESRGASRWSGRPESNVDLQQHGTGPFKSIGPWVAVPHVTGGTAEPDRQASPGQSYDRGRRRGKPLSGAGGGLEPHGARPTRLVEPESRAEPCPPNPCSANPPCGPSPGALDSRPRTAATSAARGWACARRIPLRGNPGWRRRRVSRLRPGREASPPRRPAAARRRRIR